MNGLVNVFLAIDGFYILYVDAYKYMHEVVITKANQAPFSNYYNGAQYFILVYLMGQGYYDYKIFVSRYSNQIDFWYMFFTRFLQMFVPVFFSTMFSYIANAITGRTALFQMLFIENLEAPSYNSFGLQAVSTAFYVEVLLMLLMILTFYTQRRTPLMSVFYLASIAYSVYRRMHDLSVFNPFEYIHLHIGAMYIGVRHCLYDIEPLKLQNSVSKRSQAYNKMFVVLDRLFKYNDLAIAVMYVLRTLLFYASKHYRGLQLFYIPILTFLDFVLIYGLYFGRATVFDSLTQSYILRHCAGELLLNNYAAQQFVFQLYTNLYDNIEVGPYNAQVANVLYVGLVVNSIIFGNVLEVISGGIREYLLKRLTAHFNKKKQEIITEIYRKELIVHQSTTK